ncbi:MAG: AAC(3) family N-acetyltransferase [Opitutaceae bacterium]|nr:AAC(3) family N-acetyltransferase [Opitutaceae bacterium]
MHTFSSLLADLTRLGIRPRDCLLVHSSMRAIGAVEGGAETVLDALIHTVRDGLLLLPTHTWKEWNNREGIFDPATEPSCVGILPELFRRRPGVVRSWHPTHSLGGIGSGAATFLAGEERTRTPCPREGCWGRLYDAAARILFLGAPLRTNTYLHSVEEWHGIPDRIAATATLFRIRTPDGLIDCPQFRHHSSLGDVSQNYDKIEPEILRLGIAREDQVGGARSVLCEARAVADLVGRHLGREPHYFDRR